MDLTLLSLTQPLDLGGGAVTTGARGQGAHPQGLPLPSYCPSRTPQPSSLGLLQGPRPEATNLLGTAHSAAPQWPLAWARTSPEGTGGQWLSGSQGDRSSPGGIVWGHRKWDLGAMAGSARACGGTPTLRASWVGDSEPALAQALSALFFV